MFGMGSGFIAGLTRSNLSRGLTGATRAGYTAGRFARGFSGTPLAKYMGRGAMMGGVWGAVSDDTSILGGALMGATIGGIGRSARAFGHSAMKSNGPIRKVLSSFGIGETKRRFSAASAIRARPGPRGTRLRANPAKRVSRPGVFGKKFSRMT